MTLPRRCGRGARTIKKTPQGAAAVQSSICKKKGTGLLVRNALYFTLPPNFSFNADKKCLEFLLVNFGVMAPERKPGAKFIQGHKYFQARRGHGKVSMTIDFNKLPMEDQEYLRKFAYSGIKECTGDYKRHFTDPVTTTTVVAPVSLKKIRSRCHEKQGEFRLLRRSEAKKIRWFWLQHSNDNSFYPAKEITGIPKGGNVGATHALSASSVPVASAAASSLLIRSRIESRSRSASPVRSPADIDSWEDLYEEPPEPKSPKEHLNK